MTYAPQSLLTLRDYLKAQTGLSAVALGIVGDAAHVKGYHCGFDRIYGPNGDGDADYSVKLARDRAGLTDAASAIDIGSFPRLRELSIWLAEQCRLDTPDSRVIREVIYSPDGQKVLRWDNHARKEYLGGTGTGQGDNSHRTHTHTSFWRDTEQADRTAIFRRFFEGDQDVTITRNRWERWKAANGNGVLRRNPVRSEAPFVRLADGDEVSSFAELRTADGNNWRLIDHAGPAYFLRTDFAPVTPGGDPVLDAAYASFVNVGTLPGTDCTPQVEAARTAWYAAGVTDGTQSGYKAGASKVGERIRVESVPALLTDVDRIVTEETA